VSRSIHDPHESGGYALRTTALAWDRTKEHWRDSGASSFDQHHWPAVEGAANEYLNSLNHLLELLAAAERETDY
jgi:hypothetical protein